MEKPNKCTESNKKSNSTPVEILTEFLTSIMLKDYETALRYCSQILTYEPENSTIKEFYPLILKKLEIAKKEELNNSCDSDESTSSASDSDSFQETDNLNASSSSSESNLSSEEADGNENSKAETSAFESLNLITTQREPGHVKKQDDSQNQEDKTLSKKKVNKPSCPCARALSTSRPINHTRTIKRNGKSKMNYKEFFSQKAGVKKIENLSHLPEMVSL